MKSSPYSNPFSSPSSPNQAGIDADTNVAGILHRLSTAHNVPLRQATAVGRFIGGIVFLIGLMISYDGLSYSQYSLVWNLMLPILLGFVSGGIYYGFAMLRWDRMIRAIKTGDFDGNGIPDSRETLVIHVTDLKGNSRFARGLKKSDLADVLNMSRSYNATRRAPFDKMHKTYKISRGQWNKINEKFSELGLIAKAGNNNNDPWEKTEGEYAAETFTKLAFGDYQVVQDIVGEL